MHALKHPLWVLYWQLVGAVHSDGGLAGARKDSLQKCVCVSRDVPICILSTWTSGPLMQQCKPAFPMQCFDVWQMGTLCAKPRQGAVPWPESQSGPGLQSHSKAAWQAALAFGWPLPPPGRPHSLTYLISLTGATKQIEGIMELAALPWEHSPLLLLLFL